MCVYSTHERKLTFAFAKQLLIFRKLLSSTSFEPERRLVLLLQRSSNRTHPCIAITLSFTQLLASQSPLRYDNRPLRALSRSRSPTPHLRVQVRLIGSSRRVGAPFLDDWPGSAHLRKSSSASGNRRCALRSISLRLVLRLALLASSRRLDTAEALKSRREPRERYLTGLRPSSHVPFRLELGNKLAKLRCRSP